MEAPPGDHLTADVLRAFALGLLDDATAVPIQNHLEACPTCCAQVANLSGDDFIGRLRAARNSDKAQATLPPTVPGAPPELRDHEQYEVLAELGRGGMGVVYLVRNRNMRGRLEVLKIINPILLGQADVVKRFLREIEAASQLNHAHIVTAYAMLQKGSLLGLAMEYVPGQDLTKVVAANGPLPVANACAYACQTALGLQYAFEKGMVHRDIKPQNLILDTSGELHVVKIVDFGLAKVTREEAQAGHGLTATGAAMGTPHYLAPEQAVDASRADIRADLYSLGCTLYFLLAGEPPFQAKSLKALFQAHETQQAVALDQLRQDVPAELAAVVAKLMAKEPEQRYQKPVDAARELASFAHAELNPLRGAEKPPVVVTALEQGNAFPSATLSSPVLVPSPSTLRRGTGSRRWRFGVGVAVVLLTVMVGLWVGGVFQRKKGESGKLPFPEGAHPIVPARGAAPPGGGNSQKSAPQSARVKAKPEHSRSEPAPMNKNRRPALLDCTGTAGVSATEMRKAQAAWAKYLGLKVLQSVEIADGVTMTFVLVPPGKFLMGSPKEEQDYVTKTIFEGERPSWLDLETLHVVTLTEPFYLGKYEVTQEQYKALAKTNKTPSWFKGAANLPVENVSWDEAQRWAAQLTLACGDGREFRLPTEAEWEYSCRAGRPSGQPFAVGDGVSLSSEDANINGNYPYGTASKGRYRQMTSPVGSYRPNALGLYDMHGNVGEWCSDYHGPYPVSPVTNPIGPPRGLFRILRGGNWNYGGRDSRAAYRGGFPPEKGNTFVGFRLAYRVPSDGQ